MTERILERRLTKEEVKTIAVATIILIADFMLIEIEMKLRCVDRRRKPFEVVSIDQTSVDRGERE